MAKPRSPLPGTSCAALAHEARKTLSRCNFCFVLGVLKVIAPWRHGIVFIPDQGTLGEYGLNMGLVLTFPGRGMGVAPGLWNLKTMPAVRCWCLNLLVLSREQRNIAPEMSLYDYIFAYSLLRTRHHSTSPTQVVCSEH